MSFWRVGGGRNIIRVSRSIVLFTVYTNVFIHLKIKNPTAGFARVMIVSSFPSPRPAPSVSWPVHTDDAILSGGRLTFYMFIVHAIFLRFKITYLPIRTKRRGRIIYCSLFIKCKYLLRLN